MVLHPLGRNKTAMTGTRRRTNRQQIVPWHSGGNKLADNIGDVLIRIGAMKKYQVEDVLRAQRAGDKRLFGEIAIE